MKQKFALYFFLMVFVHRVNAQWDSLPVKTKLIYSFSRGHVITNNSGTKEDVNKIYFNKKDTITIDTILNLSGQNRKIILLSKSLNDVVLNEYCKIYKGKINRPEDYEKIYNITGQLITNDSCTSVSSQQVTAIYQYNNAIYFLTLPNNFYQSINSKLINQIDKVLLKSIIDSVKEGPYITDVFITVNGENFPLKPVIWGKRKAYNKLNGDFSFDYEDDNQGLPFEESALKLRAKSQYIKFSGKYVNRSNKGEPLKTLYLSPKYGIVHSYSYSKNKQKGILYVNIFDLQKVELPNK